VNHTGRPAAYARHSAPEIDLLARALDFRAYIPWCVSARILLVCREGAKEMAPHAGSQWPQPALLKMMSAQRGVAPILFTVSPSAGANA
jgi:hypothetical protein